MTISQEHHSLAKALYQLDFYLRQLGLEFTVKDIYREAYQKRRGSFYKDDWLDRLRDDPDMKEALAEPFTTHTIAETLLQTGHEPILRTLIGRIREAGIGYMQAYIIGAGRRR